VGISKDSVLRILNELKLVKKIEKWVPHTLNDGQLEMRVQLCRANLGRCRSDYDTFYRFETDCIVFEFSNFA